MNVHVYTLFYNLLLGRDTYYESRLQSMCPPLAVKLNTLTHKLHFLHIKFTF